MADEAHVKTDEYIEALRQKIAKEYKAAEQDAQQKLNQYLERFADRDKKMRAKLDRGEITQTAYREWKVRQITTGTRFQDLRDSIANEYHHASEMAQKYARDALPDVYALNHNYATYSIEKEAGIDTSYILYNHDSVERLIRDNPKLLPDPDPESETAKKLAENKDLRWNREHITSAITRGIMTGDSIDQLAKRLRSVTNMDNAASVRNARTAVTSAQNAGREDAYKRAERMNIDLVREWVATLDNRTRDSHRAMHGEERDGDTFSNGLEYPGDMSANVDPSEIYNCRCTMISHVAGFPVEIPKSSPKMTESFEEWQKGKKQEQPKKEEPKKTVEKRPATEVSAFMVRNLEAKGVKPVEFTELQSPLTTEEIIAKLAGGDMTGGSCVSLTWAYAANRAGYDVRDYRGGESRKYFYLWRNTGKISNFDGVISTVTYEKHDTAAALSLLSKVETGKEYIFNCGNHQAIVRKENGVLQYLEMQSPIMERNTFHELNEGVLKSRFGSVKNGRYERMQMLLELDSLTGSGDFAAIMPYINTEESKQKKGILGHEY